jgi:hypothetical protein
MVKAGWIHSDQAVICLEPHDFFKSFRERLDAAAYRIVDAKTFAPVERDHAFSPIARKKPSHAVGLAALASNAAATVF